MAIKSAPSAATIQEFLTYALPGLADYQCVPSWPPDAFAITAALLQRSGAYRSVVQNWPPALKALHEWVDEMRRLGLEWRAGWVSSKTAPQPVQSWWDILVRFQASDIPSICDNPDLCEALLQICAAADEASSGFGVPPGEQGKAIRLESKESDDITKRITGVANGALDLSKSVSGSTLCRQIHPSRLRVLPKLHFPQNGLTIRSLSRNLALCTGDEIRPHWIDLRTSKVAPTMRSFNLLLLPWPQVVRPSQFTAVPVTSPEPKQCMAQGFRFFGYTPEASQIPPNTVRCAMERARKLVGSIDGVVLPELAVPADSYEALRDEVLGQNAFLIAGVAKQPKMPGDPGENAVYFSVPSVVGPVDYEQNKHHRWKLDKSQIIQYGLGSILDPDKFWWEHIRIGSRKLNFAAIQEWLTLSVLICEDLARPDPVGDVVRAVGPNLVIALLMDGPQLSSRWAGRYATVLADDPGCSVLSITSHGMAKLCRPLYVTPKPHVVALWKDAKSVAGPVEIEMGPSDAGVVLCLTVQYLEEFTADGRSDRRATGYPILAGIHPVPA